MARGRRAAGLQRVPAPSRGVPPPRAGAGHRRQRRGAPSPPGGGEGADQERGRGHAGGPERRLQDRGRAPHRGPSTRPRGGAHRTRAGRRPHREAGLGRGLPKLDPRAEPAPPAGRPEQAPRAPARGRRLRVRAGRGGGHRAGHRVGGPGGRGGPCAGLVDRAPHLDRHRGARARRVVDPLGGRHAHPLGPLRRATQRGPHHRPSGAPGGAARLLVGRPAPGHPARGGARLPAPGVRRRLRGERRPPGGAGGLDLPPPHPRARVGATLPERDRAGASPCLGRRARHAPATRRDPLLREAHPLLDRDRDDAHHPPARGGARLRAPPPRVLDRPARVSGDRLREPRRHGEDREPGAAAHHRPLPPAAGADGGRRGRALSASAEPGDGLGRGGVRRPRPHLQRAGPRPRRRPPPVRLAGAPVRGGRPSVRGPRRGRAGPPPRRRGTGGRPAPSRDPSRARGARRPATPRRGRPSRRRTRGRRGRGR